MKSLAELVDVANRSFIGSCVTLAEHSEGGKVRDEGGVFSFVTGHPLSLFNGCIVVKPAVPERLEVELEWVRAHRVPFRAWIASELESALEDVPLRLGLVREQAPYPGMTLHPVPPSPDPGVGVAVVQIGSAAFDDFLAVAIELGLHPALASRVFTPSFAADPNVRFFVGLLDGRRVGTSIAIRTGDVSGVYNVATLSAARRRGVGTALTWAATQAGLDWGSDTIVLQSSEMARALYGAMGFRTVVEYTTYVGAPEA